MELLAALILSCSFHYDDHLVEAIARKLSITNQYFVGDLSDLNTYDSAHSVAEAGRIVDAIIAKGHRPAVGFMAVPVTWAARFGRTTDDLFDSCTNISIATAMLSDYERSCTLKPDHQRPTKHTSRRRRQHLSSPALRYCILRRLEIDLNITGVVEHVLPEAAKLDAAPADPDVDPPQARAALFPDNTDTARLHESTDWSSQRLFLSPPAPFLFGRPLPCSSVVPAGCNPNAGRAFASDAARSFVVASPAIELRFSAFTTAAAPNPLYPHCHRRGERSALQPRRTWKSAASKGNTTVRGAAQPARRLYETFAAVRTAAPAAVTLCAGSPPATRATAA